MTPDTVRHINQPHEANRFSASRVIEVVKNNKNRVTGTLLTLAPVALGVMTTAAYSADGGEGGNGIPSSITLLWGGQRDTIPSSYNGPVIEAGKICSGISSSIVAGVAAVEDGPTFSWNPTQLSPAGAIGPMQFEPATIDWLEKKGVISPGFDPTNVSEAVPNGAKYLCDLYNGYGGDLNATLEAYNGGAPGYASEVEGVANSVIFNYPPTNNGGGGSNPSSSARSDPGAELPLGVSDASFHSSQEVDFGEISFQNESSASQRGLWVGNGTSFRVDSRGNGSFNAGHEHVVVHFGDNPPSMYVTRR
jgi:hypothetical protein